MCPFITNFLMCTYFLEGPINCILLFRIQPSTYKKEYEQTKIIWLRNHTRKCIYSIFGNKSSYIIMLCAIMFLRHISIPTQRLYMIEKCKNKIITYTFIYRYFQNVNLFVFLYGTIDGNVKSLFAFILPYRPT